MSFHQSHQRRGRSHAKVEEERPQQGSGADVVIPHGAGVGRSEAYERHGERLDDLDRGLMQPG